MKYFLMLLGAFLIAEWRRLCDSEPSKGTAGNGAAEGTASIPSNFEKLVRLAGALTGDRLEGVTSDKAFWGGYIPGAVYELAESRLYDGRDLDDGFYWPLNTCGSRRVGRGMFMKNPAAYPGVVEIPSGTRFSIVVIRKRTSLEYSQLELVARFVNGPAAGELFDAGRISVFRHKGEWGIFEPSAVIRKVPDV